MFFKILRSVALLCYCYFLMLFYRFINKISMDNCLPLASVARQIIAYYNGKEPK